MSWVEQGVRFTDCRGASSAVSLIGWLVVDFRPPWPYFAQHVIGPSLAALGWAATVIRGLRRDIASARRLALSVLCLLSLIALVASAGYLSIQRPPLAFGPLTLSIYSAIAAAALWRAEVLLADACILIGLLAVLLAAAEDCALFADCPHLLASPPALGVAALLAGAVFALLRRRFCARLIASIAEDRRHYDCEWREVLALTGSEAALRELDALARAAPAGPVRHLLPSRREPSPAPRALRRTGSSVAAPSLPGAFRSAVSSFSVSFRSAIFAPWADGIGDEGPVTSLDQLYAQA